MQKGQLLARLAELEARLPVLLTDGGLWRTLDVDYEPPRVERLWRDVDDARLYLHRIHPCEKALFHPHPWPSAVKVVAGMYEMGIGYSRSGNDPPEAATCILAAGSSYEMIDPQGWHYVRPLGGPSLSVMVTMRPYTLRHAGEKKPSKSLYPLNSDDTTRLFDDFRAAYPA